MKRIVIIGAGPTGLSAGNRLLELGYENFVIYERNPYAAGLCASFQDNQGFVWDLGGHVIFSHYEYFNQILDLALGTGYVEHARKAWVRTKGLWIPYPFQNHISYLPEEMLDECIKGLKKIGGKKTKNRNFKEWILHSFGNGIAKYFMVPYNKKTWAFPLSSISTAWLDERVSTIDAIKIITQTKPDAASRNWGPNATFRYPLKGGTAAIFKKITERLREKIEFTAEALAIDVDNKTITLSNGKQASYDVIINTSPLDTLVNMLNNCDKKLRIAAKELRHNSLFVVGIGMRQACPSDKCWVYFPDSDSPFFRVTYLSNYSPCNVADSKSFYSLLCETTYSKYKKHGKATIVEKTIQGLINSGLLKKSDRESIVSTFLFDIEYAYPIPTLQRDKALRVLCRGLQNLAIYSRGRFGAWKYEIGNTDHSVMQGKEIIDTILLDAQETVWRP